MLFHLFTRWHSRPKVNIFTKLLGVQASLGSWWGWNFLPFQARSLFVHLSFLSSPELKLFSFQILNGGFLLLVSPSVLLRPQFSYSLEISPVLESCEIFPIFSLLLTPNYAKLSHYFCPKVEQNYLAYTKYICFIFWCLMRLLYKANCALV